MAPSILLIDDDANFRRALRIALALEGLRVTEAGSTDEARDAISGRSFDCVVVNLLTAGGDPKRLLEKVRTRNPSAGRIVCSVHPELLGTFRLLDPDAVILEKPFSTEALLDVAAPWIRRRVAALAGEQRRPPRA